MNKVRYILNLFLIVTLFSSCVKEVFELDNLNKGKVDVLGHRGMGVGYKYPGNTIESIIPALKMGSHGVEMDIQMTKDNVLVVFHDKDLSSKTTFKGNVYEYTWEELKECKYHALSQDVYIHSLEEILSRIDNRKSYMYSLDCKMFTDTEDKSEYRYNFVQALKKVFNIFHVEENLIIEGDSYLLKEMKDQGINSQLFLSHSVNFNNTLSIASNLELHGVVSSYENLSKEEVRVLHDNGIKVMLWGMKTHKQNQKALNKNPDIVQTDKPIPLLKQFNLFNYNYRIP